MSLADLISSSHKEIVGSRTKNRLTVQISYAIQLIIDYYSTNFLIMMDYIEDISVITNPDNPDEIHLYQVKTKTTDRQYTLSTIISDKWFQKLYRNAEKFKPYLTDASMVCNTDIISSNTVVFPNERTLLDDPKIQSNIIKIRKAISKDLKIPLDDVDLSKFYFIRTSLSVNRHKEEAEYQFQHFLFDMDNDIQLATTRSIYTLLYDTLDKQFNSEINEDCTDIQEIYRKKGLQSSEIKTIIDCGLAIQLPDLGKLFAEYNIKSLIEKRKYSSIYPQIKIDFYSNIHVFSALKNTILSVVNTKIESGISSFDKLLEETYKEISSDASLPQIFRDEHYLKLLIMVIAYKYCNGSIYL